MIQNPTSPLRTALRIAFGLIALVAFWGGLSCAFQDAGKEVTRITSSLGAGFGLTIGVLSLVGIAVTARD